MRVVKDNELGLLTNVFGIKEKFYFVVSTLIFFDFDKPDELLTEQDMWKCLPEQLGEGQMLDMAMAKPNAEFLACGSCFSPEGTTRNASEVKIRVGELSKTLNIFGDRYWKNIGGTNIISDPIPFSQMPINWQTAFGGADFPENKLGKGDADVLDAAGNKVKLLPNIEMPSSLIGLPEDKPAPASFFHYPFDAPHRQKKLGSYDDQWFRERWPYFPVDMDYSYYNAAPQDQIKDGFWKGDESIEILNMHPNRQLIQSKLPGKRIRCFFQQNEKCEIKDEDLVFKEIETHLDTVWLFPSANKGVCIYRGTTEVIDEELFDVFRLNMVAEDLTEQPKSKEHYLDVLKKKIDKSISIDMTPFIDAKKKVAAGLKKIADIPKVMEDIKQRGLGNAPVPMTTPAQKTQEAKKVMLESIDLLKNAEQKVLDVKAKYGHIMKMDTSKYGKSIKKLEHAMTKMDQLEKKGNDVIEQRDKTLAKMADQVEQAKTPHIKAALLEKGADINVSFYPKDWTKWVIAGHQFVSTCWFELRQGCDYLKKLESLGFRKRIINKALFGYNSEPLSISNAEWGFEDHAEEIVIPAGFVIPYYEGAILKRIRVLPDVLSDEADSFIVPGSEETPLSVGLSDSKAAVAVSREIEAWKLFGETDDFAGTIALASPDAAPSDADAETLKAVPIFLKALPSDEAQANAIMAEGWEDAGLSPMLLEKETQLFDAEKEGVNLQRWVFDHIPEGLFDEPISYVDDDDSSPVIQFKLPKIDPKGIVESTYADLKAPTDVHRIDIKAIQEKGKAELVDFCQKMNLNPDDYIKPSTYNPDKPFDYLNSAADTLKTERDKLKTLKKLPPDAEQKMMDHETKLRGYAVKADQKYKEGMAKLKALKEKKPMPGMEKVAAMKAKMGIPADPGVKVEGIDSLKLKMENGESLKGVNLTGYDFTGMDFTDQDFSGAILNEAIFKNTILNNANLSKAICNGTDFTGASIKHADFTKIILNGVTFTDATCTGTNFTKAIFTKTDLSNTALDECNVEHALFNESQLINVSACQLLAKHTVFEKSILDGAKFNESTIPNTIFSNTSVEDVDFSNITGKALTFWKTTGEDVKFVGAEIPSIRIVEENSLNGINFQNAKMKKACITDAEMEKAVFTGCFLENAMLERNNLQQSDFSGVNAKFARFNRSDMRNSNLKKMNIMQGSLRKVQLFGSDLTGTNLYSAELYKLKTGETKLDGVNFDMTKLENREDLIP